MLIFSIKTAILATNFLHEHICAHEWDYASKLNNYLVFWKENMATSPNFPEIPSFTFLKIVLQEKLSNIALSCAQPRTCQGEEIVASISFQIS